MSVPLARNPLRILFLTESFHPVLGGGETHIRRLGSALVKGGDRATVVTRRAGLAADQGVRWESEGAGEFSIEMA